MNGEQVAQQCETRADKFSSFIPTQPSSWSPDHSTYVHVTCIRTVKMLKRIALLSPFYISFCFPHRSQRAYYSHFFFSENGRNVFVGGYQPLPPPPSLPLPPPSNVPPFSGYIPIRGSGDLVEGVSGRGGKSFSFLFFPPSSTPPFTLHPRRDTFTYISALVTLVGASFLGNLHPERAPH